MTKKWLKYYKTHRPNSLHIINDAQQIDYKNLFQSNNVPLNIDYLQIDLHVSNNSTLKTLQKLDNEIFDKYKFATITFEHDIYVTNKGETRKKSREIFKNRGYELVFPDIHHMHHVNVVWEDWYVHPDLVDMKYINILKEKNLDKYVNNKITGKSINWQDIEY